MSAVMPDGNSAALAVYQREQDEAYAAAEEIEDRRDELVIGYLDKISSDGPEIGDFLGGYLADDPQAMTALIGILRASKRSLGIEANREALIQAAARFAELTLECADVQFGNWLVQKEMEK